MSNKSENYTFIQNSSLALTVLALGIMAGFFWTYTFNVNRAMLSVSGEHYAIMQSLFNVNVRHGMFFSFFFGAGVVAFITVLVNLKHRAEFSFWLIVIAVVTYIVGIIIYTKQVNLPLNVYTESWNPQALPSDWQTTRDSWNSANVIRVITSFSAFVAALLALTLRSLK